MTNEEINGAIANICGWTDINITHRSGRAPDASYIGSEFIPDYCSDLNAMHRVECGLYSGIKNQEYWQKGKGAFQLILGEITTDPISATARQRAEAFLRTLGKWNQNT